MNQEDLVARLRPHVQDLAGGIGERNSIRYEGLERARLYIEERLSETGYEIQHDAYEVAGRTYRNVLAERRELACRTTGRSGRKAIRR